MRSPTQPPARRANAVLTTLALSIPLLVLSLASLPSCGKGGDGESGADKTERVEELRDEARAALDAIEAAEGEKLFADKFKREKDRYDEAMELLDEGSESDAYTKFRLAKRGFDNLLKDAKAVKAAREELLAAKKAADAAETAARAAKADVDAPREFKDAQATYKRAADAMASTDARKLQAAKRTFDKAAQYFQQTIETAKSMAAIKIKADSERTAALTQKVKAKEAGAEEHANLDWNQGEQLMRSAEADLKTGNYQTAYQSFLAASNAFATAIQQANTMKELASNQPSGGTVDLGVGPRDRPSPSGNDPAPTPRPETARVDPPVRTDLSDEDLYLLQSYKQLSPAISSYDPDTGAIKMEWGTGVEMRKNDLHFPWRAAPFDKRYLKFTDPMDFDMGSASPFGQDPTKKPQPQGDPTQEALPFTFTGMVIGYFLIPVPLTGDLTISYTMDLGLMDPNGQMNVIFFAERGGNQAYGVNFINTWARSSSNTTKNLSKVANPNWRRSANMWFDKTRTVPMRIEIASHPKNEGKKTVTVWYKYGQDDGEYPASLAVIDADKATGYVGFQWKRARFNVRQLLIEGTLEKKMAVEELLKENGLKEVPKQGDAASGAPGGDEGDGGFKF